MPEYSSVVINGWTIFAHLLFLDEISTLIEQVEKLKCKDPANYLKKNASAVTANQALSRGTNLNATPLLHQRWPVGAGPSLNTCP